MSDIDGAILKLLIEHAPRGVAFGEIMRAVPNVKNWRTIHAALTEMIRRGWIHWRAVERCGPLKPGTYYVLDEGRRALQKGNGER